MRAVYWWADSTWVTLAATASLLYSEHCFRYSLLWEGGKKWGNQQISGIQFFLVYFSLLVLPCFAIYFLISVNKPLELHLWNSFLIPFRVSDFLMGDVDSSSGLGIPQTRRSRVRHHLNVLFLLSSFGPAVPLQSLAFKHDRVQRGVFRGAILTSLYLKKPQRLVFSILWGAENKTKGTKLCLMFNFNVYSPRLTICAEIYIVVLFCLFVFSPQSFDNLSVDPGEYVSEKSDLVGKCHLHSVIYPREIWV